LKALRKCFILNGMNRTKNTAILSYQLVPDDDAKRALEETFAAYSVMMSLLEQLTEGKSGANLVTLHDLAYETVRARTGLPARLVTLGLRDFASAANRLIKMNTIPLDEKLFAIKGPTELTVSTVRGRYAIPYHVIGYSHGNLKIFNAELAMQNNSYQIHIGVATHAHQTKDTVMMNEGILARMGRLIAGLANAAVDKAEGSNKIIVVEQALKEIDQAADEARTDLGKVRAEEYRILSRRDEIVTDIKSLDEKIQLAISEDRENLAKAGVARQIDLESQLAALDKALADVRSNLEEGQQALQAVLATRREADARLAELKRSMTQFHNETTPAAVKGGAANGAARAAAAISRVTGVPNADSAAHQELDELDRLHRQQAIECRLAQFKTQKS
jgi:phage shock protein A